MAVYSGTLIAIWDGKSRGTKNIIRLARRHGLQVFVYLVDDLLEAREPVRAMVRAA